MHHEVQVHGFKQKRAVDSGKRNRAKLGTVLVSVCWDVLTRPRYLRKKVFERNSKLLIYYAVLFQLNCAETFTADVNL